MGLTQPYGYAVINGATQSITAIVTTNLFPVAAVVMLR